jgi:SMODS and SLOG-associating 2TM effector domain 1/SMODS and SLOG-associating 2TM effector domain 3
MALVAFLAALAAEVYVISQKPDRAWYEGRAAAESVKTLAWRFMVGGEPFALEVPPSDVDALYLGRVKDVLRDLNEVEFRPALAGQQQITDDMRQVRRLTLNQRRDVYASERIEGQRAWYARKSAWNSRRSFRWSLAAIALEFFGIVGGAIKAFELTDVDLLGLLATAAAGIIAWVQAKQFQTLSNAYFVASQELASIRSQMASPMTELEWARYVQEAEEAISREHILWRASHGVRIRLP